MREMYECKECRGYQSCIVLVECHEPRGCIYKLKKRVPRWEKR